MSKLTRHQFPAVVEPAIHVELDLADDELPTDPIIPLGQRDTERPSGELQAALQEATKPSGEWRQEPLFAIDHATGKLILAMPYTAIQTDRFGVVFEVGCPVGTELHVPTSVNQAQFVRSVLVEQVMRVRRDTVMCYAPGSERGAQLSIDDGWRVGILQAFIDGDAGRLARG